MSSTSGSTECVLCGNAFTPRANMATRAKYCSKPCRQKAGQERVKRFHAENPGASMRYKSRSSPEAKARTKASQKRHHVASRFGISVEEYDAYLAGAACAICKTEEDLVLDHDHGTGRIRGVLCRQHNAALGNLGDTASALWSGFAYLIGAPTRPDFTAYYMMMADEVGKRSDCTRAKVGSVLVDRNDRVLGVGYIGVAPGLPGCMSGACPRGKLSLSDQPRGGGYDNCISTHSEVNCLRNSQSTEGATMYTNRKPCEECQAAIQAAGVTRVVYPGGQIHYA